MPKEVVSSSGVDTATVLHYAAHAAVAGVNFSLMARAQARGNDVGTWFMVLGNGAINAILYTRPSAAAATSLLAGIRRHGILGASLKSAYATVTTFEGALHFVELNFAYAGGLMMPGDFASIADKYPAWVTPVFSSLAWAQEGTLLFEPIDVFVGGSIRYALSCCGVPGLVDHQLKNITYTLTSAINTAEDALALVSARAASGKRTATRHQILDWLRDADIPSGPGALRHAFTTQFQVLHAPSAWNLCQWPRHKLVTLAVGTGVATLALPFYLGTAGSTTRGAEWVSHSLAGQITMKALPPLWLSNALGHSSIADVYLGFNMFLLFTYFPSQAAAKVLDEMLLAPLIETINALRERRYLNCNAKKVALWLLKALIVFVAFNTLLSTRGIVSEGQRREHGWPGKVIGWFEHIGLGLDVQANVIATALNTSGVFGLLELLLEAARMGNCSPGLCFTDEYDDQTKALHALLEGLKATPDEATPHPVKPDSSTPLMDKDADADADGTLAAAAPPSTSCCSRLYALLWGDDSATPKTPPALTAFAQAKAFASTDDDAANEV